MEKREKLKAIQEVRAKALELAYVTGAYDLEVKATPKPEAGQARLMEIFKKRPDTDGA